VWFQELEKVGFSENSKWTNHFVTSLYGSKVISINASETFDSWWR